MILDYGILILDNILMIETFEHIDFFFDCADVLFADWYFLHGYKDSIIEVYSFVYFSVSSFSDLLDQLIALDSFVFCKSAHRFFIIKLIFEWDIQS